MIPFWKKTGKHSKPQSTQKRRQKAKPAVPRTAQQSIPMQRMFEDGTCRVRPGYYTRTIQYQDINYQLAQQEDKTAIFEEWCSFLNFFDSSIKFELSFVNMATDSTEFEKSIRIPFQKDGFDDVRAEYSQMLRQQLAKGNNGLTKTKFITFGVEGESMAQVKPRLDHIQNDLLNNFHRLVDVAPEFMDFLKDYYAQWKAQKKLMGASWQKNLEKKGSKYAQSLLDLRGNDFVICNDYGFPINPDSYGALVRRVGKKAGIEKIHPHMFRHTFVSILLSNPNIGVATVAAEAGHAQPSTTLAIYTQVYDRRRDEIRKQMSRELYK